MHNRGRKSKRKKTTTNIHHFGTGHRRALDATWLCDCEYPRKESALKSALRSGPPPIPNHSLDAGAVSNQSWKMTSQLTKHLLPRSNMCLPTPWKQNPIIIIDHVAEEWVPAISGGIRDLRNISLSKRLPSRRT